MPAIDKDARLARLREHFVDTTLSGVLLLSVFVLAVSFWRNFYGPLSLRSPIGFASLGVATCLLAVVRLVRHRLSYRVKAWTLTGFLLSIGATGLISFGLAAPSGNFFAMAFFVAAVLFTRGELLSIVAAVAGLIAMVGFAVLSGHYVVSVNIVEASHQPAAWINMICTLALSAGIIASALSSFTQAVYALLDEVDQQQRQIEKQRDRIRHLATHDNLTGLPVLRLAQDRVQMAVEQARRNGQRMALLFIDLDGFKLINDRFGHDAGDCVLREVAQRLRRSVRAADTAARIGGDEFMVVLGALVDTHAAGEVAEKILRRMAPPISYHGESLSVGASIGIAVYPDHGLSQDALKRAADQAMYRVKNSCKNAYGFAAAPAEGLAQTADALHTAS